jgi:hypothetical protein
LLGERRRFQIVLKRPIKNSSKVIFQPALVASYEPPKSVHAHSGSDENFGEFSCVFSLSPNKS